MNISSDMERHQFTSFSIFSVDGTGAGLGKPVVVVNGGKVSCHVSTTSTEKFNANFIPHTAGRFRLDIKFNGEKVPQSPLFVEVRLTVLKYIGIIHHIYETV